MKAHEVIRKATTALAESVGSIINNDDSTEAEKVQELAKTFAQAEGYLLDELPDGMVRTEDFLKQLQYEGDLREAIKEAEAEALVKGEFDTKPHDPAISFDVGDHRMKFPNKRALAVWLAAQERIHKSNPEDNSMTTPEQLEAERIKKLKALGDDVITIAKSIVAKDESLGLDEHDWTLLVTAHAKRQHPDLSEPCAFEKVFAAPTEEGRLLREAHAVVRKDMMASFTPVVVDGTAANPDDARAATQALERLVAEERSRGQWRSTEELWDYVMRQRPDLAARAFKPPAPTTSYPMPR